LRGHERVVSHVIEIRHAVRLLLKNPGLTAIAVLSPAIGIGVNS
jgi:hypothetical protein